MAATDARPVPIKNTAYRVVFPILDADGDLVTGATALDSEVSKDQGTFADCTNEATEIATSSGMYYLDLTSTEMNADCVAVIVKTTSTGAKTTPIILYPQEAGDIKVDIETAAGTAWASGAITAASIAADAIGASELAADAANEIADAILARNIAGGSSAGRTVKQALYFLRNKWTVSGGTLTVYQTDDATSEWTASVTGTAGADPITTNDPA